MFTVGVFFTFIVGPISMAAAFSLYQDSMDHFRSIQFVEQARDAAALAFLTGMTTLVIGILLLRAT